MLALTIERGTREGAGVLRRLNPNEHIDVGAATIDRLGGIVLEYDEGQDFYY